MSAEVCSAHIGLYVNDFSRAWGSEERAVIELLRRAEAAGIIPASQTPLFI